SVGTKAQLEVPKRFYSLDALRGVAALGVVFWHWQHFFYTGTHKADFDRGRQPFYGLFYLFYEKGWMAVDLFFSLSGFIFFWLYAKRIESRRIVASEFSMLRLSRLYPLHLATLLFVAATQWWIHSRTGDYVVYPLNGMQQFLAHLLFVSGWRSSWADSFNAPVWSVSVEVFLYGTFFALFRVFRRRTIPLIALVVLGAVLKFHIPIGRGIYSFFLGGLAYYAFSE